MNPVIKKFQFGQSTVTLETGRIARQASGAVLVTVDDDVTVLVTVVGAKTALVDYRFCKILLNFDIVLAMFAIKKNL